MDRTCEFIESCGLDYCMHDIECPVYQKKMKPILFSTGMVRAIKNDRKTMTRRIILPQPTHQAFQSTMFSTYYEQEDGSFLFAADGTLGQLRKPKYQNGDILYVRETWGDYEEMTPYLYKADIPDGAKTYEWDEPDEFGDKIICDLPKWHPSIHMPKEAARLFLRVSDIRAERLCDITEEDAIKEGFRAGDQPCGVNSTRSGTAKQSFMWTWQRLYDKGEYPWISNPWVWVYEFEKCAKLGGAE